MRLKHVVITAVARDDLKDGGANHFARTIEAIREMDPSIIIEVLVPDFHAQDWCIQIVLDAGPDIFNHNMETVERLTPARSVAREISHLAPCVAPRQGACAECRDQERRHARPRRNRAGTFPDDGRSARSRLPGLDPRPISAARRRSICRSSSYVTPEQFEAYGEIARAKGFRACRLRSARPQLLSRGGFSSGRPLRDAGANAAADRSHATSPRSFRLITRRDMSRDVARADSGATRSCPRGR